MELREVWAHVVRLSSWKDQHFIEKSKITFWLLLNEGAVVTWCELYLISCPCLQGDICDKLQVQVVLQYQLHFNLELHLIHEETDICNIWIHWRRQRLHFFLTLVTTEPHVLNHLTAHAVDKALCILCNYDSTNMWFWKSRFIAKSK